MAASIIPFPSRRPIVFVDVCEQDNGCWGIYQQRPGHAPVLVETRFALSDAEMAGRQISARLGADFLDDAPPDQPGAA